MPGLQSMNPYGYDPSQAVSQGQNWASQGQNAFNFGNQALQQGFDPQNALYNRTAQQVQDFSRASSEARGIDKSPYGAGLENQAMSNFDIDWQNNALQRQNTAANTASTLYGAGGQAISGGQGIASSVPQMMSTYAGGLQQLGMGAYAPQQQGFQDYSNLFSAGTGAQQNAYQQQLAQYNANQAASSQLWGGLGKLGGNAAEMFMFA